MWYNEVYDVWHVCAGSLARFSAKIICEIGRLEACFFEVSVQDILFAMASARAFLTLTLPPYLDDVPSRLVVTSA